MSTGSTSLQNLPFPIFSLKPLPLNVLKRYIYIVIAIALDESIFLGVLHFPMKNIMSRGLEATPMGGLTSKLIQ